ENSEMEALLQVTGDKVPFRWDWRPAQLELLRLSVDRAVWTEDESRGRGHWHTEAPSTITLVRDPAEAGQFLEVLFDEETAPVRKDSKMFRLLVGVCSRVCKEDTPGRKKVDAAELGRDRWIWDGEVLNEKEVRRQLTILKSRYLDDALR